MNTTVTKCPKCNGDMEEGFIPQVTKGHRLVSQWASGAREKGFWFELKLSSKRVKSIRTWRSRPLGIWSRMCEK